MQNKLVIAGVRDGMEGRIWLLRQHRESCDDGTVKNLDCGGGYMKLHL